MISILMPTFNRAALLARAIKSFLAQTEVDFQIFVYDNASTDGTREIVAEMAKEDARIVYHRHPSNIGAIKNFLFAMEHVDTPYFAFASDDDVALPSFLAVSRDGFKYAPDAMLSATGTLEMTPAGTLLFAPLTHWTRTGYFAAGEAVGLLTSGAHPSWNTIVWRKEVLDRLGFLDTRLGLVMDLEYTVRVAANYPIFVASVPTGIFIRHEISAGEHATSDLANHYETAIERIITSGPLSNSVAATVRAGFLKLMRERLVQSSLHHLSRAEMIQARASLEAYRSRFAPIPLSVAADALCRLPANIVRLLPIRGAIAIRGKLRGASDRRRLSSSGYDLTEAVSTLSAL